LAKRLDPATFRPKLAADIEVKHFRTKRGPYVMIANPRDLIHFRIETSDAELLDLMDGTRTVEDIVVERLHATGEFDFSGIADIVTTLYQGNILEQRYVDSVESVKKALEGSTIRRKLRNFARTLTIEWSGPHKVVKWFYDHGIRWVMTPVGLVLSGAIALTGFVAFLVVVHDKSFVFGGSALALEGLIILVLNYFLTFSHEMGHAVVLVRNGRRIKAAGFQIYFGSPAWFVDSSDGLMMERTQRIAQSLAGPFTELILAGLASIAIFLFPHMRLGHVLYKFVVLNYFLVFLNLIPLLELDGYHVLAELMEMPELRSRSLTFVRHDLIRKLRTREPFTTADAGFALYGIVGVAFTVFSFILGGLYWKQLFGGFVSALWRHGLATRLILLVLGLFIGGPLIRGLISLSRLLVRRVRGYYRALRFRFETSWRIEAAELIEALPMFDDVPEETLSDLAGRVRLRSFSPGQTVVRQGQRGEAFFVVRSGRLEVFETDFRTGGENSLRILGRGESFGELAIAEATPRTASVRALEPSELFEIDKSTFQRLLAKMATVPHFEPSLQNIAELGDLETFNHLEPDDLAELLRYGEWTTFKPGETIVRQGEKADAFFAVKSGQVDILKNRRLLTTLGPGAHFGEIALLLHTERSATVRARTAVRAYRLERKGFDRILKDAFKKGTLNPNVAVDQMWSH
jgi:CRP-like cAMP-binding protein/Zn-dependent protease